MSRLALLLIVFAFTKCNSAMAQAPNNTTDFADVEICNETSERAFFASFHENMFMRGAWFAGAWLVVEPNSCRAHRRVPKGYFYWFARSDRFTWRGDKRFICFPDRGTFRQVFDDEKCIPGEELVGMHERIIDKDTDRIRLTGRRGG